MGIKKDSAGKRIDIADATPQGVIHPYAGTTAPDGWLLCDGSAIDRNTYAKLFAVIRINFGDGDGVTTFNLPDLRGQFVRGLDGSADIDPDKEDRTALITGGNTGNNIGSVQACATKLPTDPNQFVTSSNTTGNDSPDHTHSAGFISAGGATGGSPSGGGSGAYHASNTLTTGGRSNVHTHSIPSMSLGGGDAETRPTNVYVNYIIKY